MASSSNDYLTLSTYTAILHRQLQRDMNQLLIKDKLPVNITEMYLMVSILESQPISQRRAATTLAVDEGLMTRMVKHLKEIKLINKISSYKDKRVKELTLTKDGEKLLESALSKFDRWWEDFTPDLAGHDINDLGRELFEISKIVLAQRHNMPLNNSRVEES